MDMIHNCTVFLFVFIDYNESIQQLGYHRIRAYQYIMRDDIRTCEAAGWQFEPFDFNYELLSWV